jgi:hypothetical protein
MGWAEPCFSNPHNPDSLDSKLTSSGRALLDHHR